MKSIFSFLLSFCLIDSCGAHAQDHVRQHTHSFMPENELGMFDDVNAASNISQDEFESVLEKIEEYYKPIIKAVHGKDLLVTRDWEDSTVNAYATQYGDTWEIHMYGGLARRQEVTPDGFALVACHEMGHHLGGFPYSMSWAANEGQSDYFSTLSCARALMKEATAKQEFSAVSEIPAYPKKMCDESWKKKSDRVQCYRIMLAGKSLADLLSGGKAKFETPSKVEVSKTMNAHPPGQCRLDTYMAGAVCKASFDKNKIPKSEQESSKVSCLESKNQVGFRPKCWFKAQI